MVRRILPPAIVGIVGLALAACSSEPLQATPGDALSNSDSAGGDALGAGSSYVPVDYPPGPYGSLVGSTVPNLEFLGWHSPAVSGYDPALFEKVRFSDFYNPSGAATRPKLLVINASAVWCGVCRAEYKQLHDENVYASYRPQGVEILGALFEDQDYGPAKPEDLELWGSYPDFEVQFPMVLDPSFKLGAFFESDVTPLNMIVDTRTMKVVNVTMGYDPNPDSTYWVLVDDVLAKM